MRPCSWKDGRGRANSDGDEPLQTVFAAALLLGLTPGLAPGALTTLIVAQSLRNGPREGCKVALASRVTDAPIIVLAVALAPRAADLNLVMDLLVLQRRL